MSLQLKRARTPVPAILLALCLPALASGELTASSKDVSPVLRIEPVGEKPAAHDDDDRPRRRSRRVKPGLASFRTIDGSGNHLEETEMNAESTPLARLMPSDYADHYSEMAGQYRASPRMVSNRVCDQEESIENTLGTSDFLWQWGQFLDHDIDLTDGTNPPEIVPIEVPLGDLFFDPDGLGGATIMFNRSIYDGGTSDQTPREQLNQITGWIDASNVYGSTEERALALRTLDGTGHLRMGENDLLPDNDTDLPNATGGSKQVMFLAGDVRANEQVGLTTMHTLFVREHNRMADKIRRRNRRATGDEVYQRARQYVGGLMQAISYREFLPALLGRKALRRYRGYDPRIDARIANSFSSAAYRFGHSALSPTLKRLDRNGHEVAPGPLPLRNAFFNPDLIRAEGIEPLLRGLAHQAHQRIDRYVVDDVRNFLFGAPGQGGFDLASLNIQRGRDHGVPSYAYSRKAYGLPPVHYFSDVSRDPAVQAALADAYSSVEDVDLWVGGLAEDPMPGSHLGPLFSRMLIEQFEALRDGDRLWYERVLPQALVKEINSTRLSDVIRRNTDIGKEIPDDVFRIERARSRS